MPVLPYRQAYPWKLKCTPSNIDWYWNIYTFRDFCFSRNSKYDDSGQLFHYAKIWLPWCEQLGYHCNSTFFTVISSIILQSANAAYWNVKVMKIQVHQIKEQRGKSVTKNYLILPKLIEWKLMLTMWEIFLALALIPSSHYQWPLAPILRWVILCPWGSSKKQRRKHTRTFSFESQ